MPLNYTHAGRYFITSQIRKAGCSEVVDFAITVNIPPIVNFTATMETLGTAAAVPVYDLIRSKKLLDPNPIIDEDLHEIIDYRFWLNPSTETTYYNDIYEGMLDIDFDWDKQIFVIYRAAPGTWNFIMEVTDRLDQTTFYPMSLTVAANVWPTMTIPYAPNHVVSSLATFSFTHSATLF
jgi:hypothetical protein